VGAFQLKMKTTDKILVVAPHPDDESIGVGGLLISYPERCEVIVMTDGRYADSKINPEKMKEIRRNEFCKAMEKAGITSYYFLNYEDGTLVEHQNCFSKVDFSKYSLVFLPNPNDNHGDHTAACEYAIERMKQQKMYDIKVLLYEVHTPLHEVNTYIDISKIVEHKKELVACHASQMKIHPYEQQVVALARYRGYQTKMQNAALEMYQEVDIFKEQNLYSGIERELSKYKDFTKILFQWLAIKQKCISIAHYLLEHNYASIAIYGYAQLGQAFYEEMRTTECNVKYIIDKNKNIKSHDVPICYDVEDLEYVDIVVVTATFFYNEIAFELESNCGLKSISLKTILEELQGDR